MSCRKFTTLRRTLNLQPYDPDMPLEILGVLKLASQYSVPSVCMAILRCLSEAWPHTLDDWDDQRDQVDRVAARCARAGTGGRLRGKFLDQMFPEPAAALHLVAECSIRKIVPVALLRLSILKIDGDMPTKHTCEHADALHAGSFSTRRRCCM